MTRRTRLEEEKMGILKKRVNDFPTPYTCVRAIKEGGPETKLSMVLMGLGNIMHKQTLKGLLYLAVEVVYVVFMIYAGLGFIGGLGSLGTQPQQEYWDEASQVYMYTAGDQSILILLYGVATLFLTAVMFWAWRGALKSAYKAECLDKAGKHVNTFAEDLKSLLDENLHRLLMTPPTIFIGIFTVLPLIFMICMAFTNYSKIDNHLMLFDWVGLDNFAALFDSSSILGSTFWSVLVWTLVWAFFATFSNYICGMILALLINRNGTRAKGFWRFCFVLTCAVPMFVAADYAHHASAGGRGKRTSAKSRDYRPGRQSSVFHRPHLGKGDRYRHQCMGRRSLYAAAAYGRSPEYSGRALRGCQN